MKVFWDSDCLLHNPPYEILSGDKLPYFESPARLQLIKKELEQYPSLFTFESASSSSESSQNLRQDIPRYIQMVHSQEYLRYLSNAYDNWVRSGGSTVLLPLPSLMTVILTLGVLRFPVECRAT
jgi:acetoin utilization deacetylase AcuC-like enzyme